MLDVAVVGLGPAGRALASRCAARGLSVLAVDPRPDAVWRPTYGVWADELEGLGLPLSGAGSVVRARAENPELRARGLHPLERPYVVLSNAALQAALPLDGVEVHAERLDDARVSGLRSEARVVVDARGARPVGGTGGQGRDGGDGHGDREAVDPAPLQTAYGIVVSAEDAAPALQGAEALLMDWRTDWAEGGTPDDHADPGTNPNLAGTPTFLYAIPLGGGEVLLEETCLAAAPGLPVEELTARLRRRLLARGVDPTVVDDPIGREVVRIPMRGRGRPAPEGTVAIGTAGRGGHAVTGYSVAHSLRSAVQLASEISEGGELDPAEGGGPRTADPHDLAERVREIGLRALLRLDTDGTLELFEAFGRLPRERQADFMSRDSGARGLVMAMWGMFAAMPPRAKAKLLWATVGLPSAPGGR